MNKVIASPHAPAAVGPYSQAIQANDTLYISGQLPIDPSTGVALESIEEQTLQSLKNIEAILTEAGYLKSDIVKCTVLLDNITDFAAMNGVYGEFFAAPYPARAAYEVAKLPLGVKVEIEAIAVKSK
ncbi:MAG: Rid family detoxifying hydrolase [Rikenellaceae bacterium]